MVGGEGKTCRSTGAVQLSGRTDGIGVSVRWCGHVLETWRVGRVTGGSGLAGREPLSDRPMPVMQMSNSLHPIAYPIFGMGGTSCDRSCRPGGPGLRLAGPHKPSGSYDLVTVVALSCPRQVATRTHGNV